MHTACLQPSLFHYSRSRTFAPPMAERFVLAQYRDSVDRPQAVAFAGAYHPIIRGIAPPGCTARAPRIVCAASAQAVVDVLAGGTALGCALVCLIVGRVSMARALLAEHKLQFIAMATGAFVLAIAAALGGSVGAVIYLSKCI